MAVEGAFGRCRAEGQESREELTEAVKKKYLTGRDFSCMIRRVVSDGDDF